MIDSKKNLKAENVVQKSGQQGNVKDTNQKVGQVKK